MQSARAGLPHLPKGDRLLESHARNSAKGHSQSEYGMRHRLTEWRGPAGLIRKVARAAYQRIKQRPRSSPTAPRLPPASAEVAAAFTFEHPDVFSGAEHENKDRACRRIGTNAAYIAASAVGLETSKAASLSRNNDTTKAINYCLSRWDAFSRFLMTDGFACRIMPPSASFGLSPWAEEIGPSPAPMRAAGVRLRSTPSSPPHVR